MAAFSRKHRATGARNLPGELADDLLWVNYDPPEIDRRLRKTKMAADTKLQRNPYNAEFF